MNYTQFVTRLIDALGDLQRDVNFPLVVPNAIELSEQRCYRDLQLLGTVVRDSTQTCSPNSRDVTLPSTTVSGHWVTVTEVNVCTPVGAGTSTGTRNSLIRTTPRLINFLFPTEVSTFATQVPTMFAMNSDQSIIVGPSAGSSFFVEFVGTNRPTPLSSTNITTYLSNYLPDVFFASAMTAVCYTLGDKAESKASYWNAAYEKELVSANLEEAKKKYMEYYSVTQLPAPQDTHATLGRTG